MKNNHDILLKKIHLILLLTLFIGSSGWLSVEITTYFTTKTYEILPNSLLEVNGKTNVNSFCCSSRERFPKGKLGYQIQTGNLEFQDARLKIRISELDCGAKAINKDLYKALQAEDYPYITIDLKQAFNLECNDLNDCDRWVDFETISDITLVCTSKSVGIPIKVKKIDEHKFRITGSTTIRLCDFGVEAPTALMGLIKVKDDLTIDFDLFVEVD